MRSPEEGSPASDWRARAALGVVVVVLVAACLAAYAGSFHGPFLYDDRGSVLDNPTIRSWSQAFRPLPSGWPVSGRPLLNASFALNYSISGLDPHSYHWTNWLIHVAAGLLLFGACRRLLLRIPSLCAAATGLAGSVALLWMVHPLQTESVTYVSQRAESLMGLCYLGSLYAFVRAYGGVRTSLVWAVVSVVAAYLGMACKEVMVTVPVMIALCDRAFVASSWRDVWEKRRRFYGCLATSWIVLAAVMASTGMRGGTVGFSSGIAWWAYALTQFRGIATYLKLSFWPQGLLFSYGLTLGGPKGWVIVDGILVLGLAVASLAGALRGSKIGFLGCWFFVILAPTSSVVPVSTELIAEHRAYLSSAAVAAFEVCAGWWVLTQFARNTTTRLRTVAVVGLASVGALASAEIAATHVRNRVYSSVLALWADTVAKSPADAGARNNYGNALADQGKLEEAIGQFQAASELSPDYADPHQNLGNVLTRLGRDAKAVDEYRLAIARKSDNANIDYNLGRALQKTGHPEEAARAFDAALTGHTELAVVWYDLGNAFLDEGRQDRALEAFGRALAMRPDYPDALLNHAGLLAEAGRSAEAIQEYRSLVRLEPEAADAHNNLGIALAQRGDYPAARTEFAAALRLKPDYREAADNLAKVESLQGGGHP